MKICIAVLVLTTVYFSCVSKPSYYSIDPKTGYFPITSTLPNAAVVAKEKFNEIKYKPMLLFRDTANDKHTDNFFYTIFKANELFPKSRSTSVDCLCFKKS
jgi:hypothetical protein